MCVALFCELKPHIFLFNQEVKNVLSFHGKFELGAHVSCGCLNYWKEEFLKVKNKNLTIKLAALVLISAQEKSKYKCLVF